MKKNETLFLTKGMFTSCPDCLQQFRIQAIQLSMASGQVECGRCGHQFNALSRLSDEPLLIDESSYEFNYEPVLSQTSGVESEFDLKLEQVQEPVFDIPESDDAVSITAEVETEEKKSDEKVSPNRFSDNLLKDISDGLSDDLPVELRESLPVKRSLVATLCWIIGIFLLLIMILAQLAWFNRDQLLVRYPQLDPVAREICEYLQCEILRYKDISAIKLINRDVRKHPLHEGSLLVNATMVNRSDTIQAFPLIQLALFNPGGEVIGFREFKPQQYLDDSIDTTAGMMPQSPIHFVLEVNGPTQEAVSFEFHFL